MKIVRQGTRLILLLAVVLGGATQFTIATPAAAQAAPTPEDAANATYTGIGDAPVTLRNGAYEGAPMVEGGAARQTVGLIKDFQLVADVNRDGLNELVVLLWENNGGSGTRLYLAHVRGGDVPAVLVGDRVQVRGMEMRGTSVVMNVLRAGADDAMCCPGELARVRWRGGLHGFEVVSDEVTGRLDMTALRGEWRLDTEASGQDGDSAEITLAVTAAGVLRGSAGCNDYTGTATFAAPNELTVGALALTLMSCSEARLASEQEFLAKLQAATQVGFHMGRLALGWRTDDGSGTLMFSAR